MRKINLDIRVKEIMIYAVFSEITPVFRFLIVIKRKCPPVELSIHVVDVHIICDQSFESAVGPLK